eukprot:6184223-Pyramimonas_sp.AAC.1
MAWRTVRLWMSSDTHVAESCRCVMPLLCAQCRMSMHPSEPICNWRAAVRYKCRQLCHEKDMASES